MCEYFVVFFFFQAEDGIRDGHVTGVQTCALPISGATATAPLPAIHAAITIHTTARRCPAASRSEERRVGKECRSRWSPDDEKKKKKKINCSETRRMKERERIRKNEQVGCNITVGE